MIATSDEQAQDMLRDGKCPVCGKNIVECGEPDGNEDSTWWQAWFECLGDSKHTYSAEPDGIGGRWALWEDEMEAFSP